MMSPYNRIVSVLNLGRMGFLDAYKVQNKFARQHLDSMAGVHGAKEENVVLLVEHNPVYTIGIRSKDYSEEYEQKLKELGAEFHRTDRGGLITFHGPGQLVAYPILNLKYFTPNMKWYICSMEKAMIGTCKYYGLNAHTTEDTGVWIGDRKIGAIGVHGRRYVTTHGVSLNCNTDLNWFKHIVPCGLEGKDVTSLSKEKDCDININDAVKPFLETFQRQFDCQLKYIDKETKEYKHKISI
ncbi:octanoyl-[acyl-carrier-protein]:protein N-octanoyltransferase LIPT2, mitochondrial-like isoform X2 [Mytilus galloprovincialis]